MEVRELDPKSIARQTGRLAGGRPSPSSRPFQVTCVSRTRGAVRQNVKVETTREVSRSVQRGSCYEVLWYHDTHLGEAAGLGFCITQQRVERESRSLSRKPLFGAKEQTRNESSFISYQSFLVLSVTCPKKNHTHMSQKKKTHTHMSQKKKTTTHIHT